MLNESETTAIVTPESNDSYNQLISNKRPVSLTVVAIMILALFGGGYAITIGSFLTGTHGWPFSRVINEPSPENGGVPWPGWDKIGSMLRGETKSFEAIPASHWWTKFKIIEGLLINPLLIAGFLGVFIGRWWGRIFLYVFTTAWISGKTMYLFLMGWSGILKFGIPLGIAVLLILALHSKGWTVWIEQKQSVH